MDRNMDKLRKMDGLKLSEELAKKQKDFADKVLMRSAGKDTDTSIFRKFKQEIARVKTVIKEKEILNEK